MQQVEEVCGAQPRKFQACDREELDEINSLRPSIVLSSMLSSGSGRTTRATVGCDEGERKNTLPPGAIAMPGMMMGGADLTEKLRARRAMAVDSL